MAPSAPPNPGLSTHSLAHNLTHLVKAAEVRSADAQRVFYPIANLWDTYLASDDVRKLPSHLRKPLAKLCTEITALTNRHFESYIRGIYNNPSAKPPQELQPPLSASPPSSQAPTPPTTYASITASTTPTTQAKLAQQKPTQQKPTGKPSNSRPDTRLFVRIGPSHPARAAGSFALLTALKQVLGTDGPLLKEVLEIPSGYALCTSSPEDLAALIQHSALIGNKISDCRVERPQLWATYRLTSVPRSVRLLDPLSQVQNHEVTGEMLQAAIQDITGQQPVKSAETLSSKENGLFNTNWTVHFTADTHKALPRSLRILGTVVQAQVVKTKPKTIQCSRCYQWHNTRTCTRPQHCNICGSHSHGADSHNSSCHATAPHQCPPKCLHCKGPHPADDLSCPLRPVPLHPKTKPEIAVILKACKAARKRSIAAANCVHTPAVDVLMASSRPVTPTQTPVAATAPSTLPARRFFDARSINAFSPLADED
jgi:hypothetical protein